MFYTTTNSRVNASSFQIIKDSMLQADDLPLSEVVQSEKWQAAFDRHDVHFGNDPEAIYTPAITLGARRINKHERFVVWLKPERPDWMSEEEYAVLPERLEIRLVDVVINQAGFRSKKYTIATTILDQKIYSRDWITSTYRSRWLVELDIRSIKCTLGMDIIRAKTPEMVRTEIWSCLLGYNLITMKMLQSCAITGRMPRSLSLTTTLQSLATNWLLASVRLTAELIQLGVNTSSSETVGNRLDRIEPRAVKRRPKLLTLLTKPRHVAKQELIAAA